jgi:hypothetical protein
MSDIEVVTSQLRQAAAQIGSAADGVQRADPHALLDAVDPALAGSASAGAAKTLSGSWQTRFAAWVRDARAHGQSLAASAATYDGTDEAAATSFAPRGVPTG